MKPSIRFILLSSVILALSACSPKLTSSFTTKQAPLSPGENIVVIDAQAALPDNAVLLGAVKVGDSGFTTPSNGTYDNVISLVREEARNAGGNVVRVTKEIPATPNYTTHRIEAEIYRLDDLALLTQVEAITPPAPSSHPDYAVIYFYRADNTIGPLVQYDVYVNDTKVYKCKRNTKAEVKLFEPGRIIVSAKTEAKTELPLNINQGEEYYIECNVSMGIFVGRPEFHVTDARVGATMYNSIETK